MHGDSSSQDSNIDHIFRTIKVQIKEGRLSLQSYFLSEGTSGRSGGLILVLFKCNNNRLSLLFP